MEKLFYEIKPYLFAIVAVAMLLNRNYNSMALMAWSLVLLFASLYLIVRRIQHRALSASKTR